eukprot:XP_001709870.1 Hypothetical protein GL50803_34897 [Giardia lamblia ATCC 50803]
MRLINRGACVGVAAAVEDEIYVHTIRIVQLRRNVAEFLKVECEAGISVHDRKLRLRPGPLIISPTARKKTRLVDHVVLALAIIHPIPVGSPILPN